jgi:hypothetical protein
MQVLDETDRVEPRLWLLLDGPVNSSVAHRRLALLKEFPTTATFAAPVSSIAQYTGAHNVRQSLLTESLPANVHLLSLNALTPSASASTILRLQHIFPVGEHPTLSQPVSVDIQALFNSVAVRSITPTTLTANKPLAQIRRPTWAIEGELPRSDGALYIYIYIYIYIYMCVWGGGGCVCLWVGLWITCVCVSLSVRVLSFAHSHAVSHYHDALALTAPQTRGLSAQSPMLARWCSSRATCSRLSWTWPSLRISALAPPSCVPCHFALNDGLSRSGMRLRQHK